LFLGFLEIWLTGNDPPCHLRCHPSRGELRTPILNETLKL
jgi:hypothetical protein